MAKGFAPTIETTVAGLKEYYRKYESKIWACIHQKLVSEMCMTPYPRIQSDLITTSYETGDMHQPFRCEFEPLELGKFKVRVNKAHHVKIDKSLGCLEELICTFLGHYERLGLDQEDHRARNRAFLNWILVEHWGAKMAEEREYASFRGRRDDAGTSFMDMADGWGTQVDDMVGTGELIPIPTGVINQGNILDRVEHFLKTIPKAVLGRKMGKLVMSEEMMCWLWFDRRQQFGQHTNYYNPTERIVLDPWGVEVVGLPGMAGSQMIMYTPTENWLHLYNERNMPTNFDIQPNHRCLDLLTDYWTGYGFRTCKYLYVNDQPAGELPKVEGSCPVLFI